MKPILLFSFLMIVNTAFTQLLGPYGHIIDQIENETQNQAAIQNHNSIATNAIIPLNKGFATIENTCGNTPPILRLFNEIGVLETTRIYNQTINPKTDASGRFIYFQNNKKHTILDTETLVEQHVPSIHRMAVTTDGVPIYYDSKDQHLYTANDHFELPFTPRAIELSDHGEIYVFGRKQYAVIDHTGIAFQSYKNGSFFVSKIINGQVYWVEKKHQNDTFQFKLNSIENEVVLTQDKRTFNKALLSKDLSNYRSDGDLILCPMFPDSIDYPFRIGNSYGEHQQYGGQPYLHPGIDILGVPQQRIYAPVDGVVKAILTTSGDIYWRLALGLEDVVEEQEGYLFAHLDPSTIPFSVGDSVSAGDYIGSIVEWPTSAFHHLHFARLVHQGEIWDGDWLTKDNVLSDITNFKDESVPVFEPLWNGQTIAFRSADGADILEPENLNGSFDIICHAHDLSNDQWRLDVDSFWFELIDLTTNSVVYEQSAFSYDFELDTYFTDENTLKILNTIYSTTQEWPTLGNYSVRQFYQQVSRSNGDGIINDQDRDVYFDSTIFPDGGYLLRIHAYDAAKNHSSTELEVIFNNSATSTDDIALNLPTIYPNPNTGHFKIKPNGINFLKGEIYNSLGQVLSVFDIVQAKEKDLFMPVEGVYYIRFLDINNQVIAHQKVVVQE